jgi:tetratricopeptide (TPR) repeat protein
LVNHHFKPWEGGVHVREMYVLANLQKARHALEDNNPAQAEQALRKALEYPPNLGVGKPDRPHNEEIWFWLGEALKAEGKTEAARAAWREAAEEGQRGFGVSRLYRGVALRRLGQTEEADKVLAPLAQIKPGEKHGAGEFYAAGLLALFENRRDAAAANFRAALGVDPDFWQARLALDRTGQ